MRYQEIKLVEDIQLDEINMSPGSLQRLAGAIDARAGMEFEMIVPDVGTVDDDYGDLEPDYDSDESVVSIEDACNFFYDGDYNGRRDIANLRQSMQEDYESYVMEQFDEYWMDNAPELIREYLTLNASDRDIIEILELAGGEAEEVEENGAGKEDYAAAAERVMDDRDSSAWYDDARDAAQNDYLNDDDRQEEWLNSAGISTMADVQRNYDITWPHYYNPNEGNGEYNIEQVASEFEDAIGRSVYHSTSYHGAHRSPTAYSLEPDGSLNPENSEDAGLEFISPPLPVNEMLEDLKKVKAWAAKRGCYTNTSTGLHINISVPNYSLRNLDYVKLALLLGDEYVLSQYGRMSNTYAKSAISKVRDKIKQHSESAKELMDKMRQHMEDLATKAIHSGSTDKYTSINTKEGYIEFRSPGGDWLGENFDKVENTLLRFVVAMDAAIDPEKYRDEYLKKLYKLLEPTAVETKNPDTIKYFADYVAGKTPKAALRSFVKQAQLERKIKRDPTGGQPYWWRVSNPGQSYGEIEVVATTKEEAIEKALLPDGYPSWARTRASIQAVPVRPYDTSPLKATVGQPQAIGQASGPTVGGRPSNPAGRWVITPEADRRSVVYRFNAAGFDDANVVRRQWAQEHPGVWIVQRDDNQTLGQPAGSSRNALSQTDIENRLGWPDQTGDANYEVVDRRTQRPVFKFVANTEQDALRKYSQYLDVMGMPEDTEDYGFREIALPGSTVDLQRQRAAAAQQQQPAPQPLGAGRELVGWDILMGGQPVHRFTGAGNNQGDANRIAQQWILQQDNDFLRRYQDEEFEVVPVWNET